MVWGARSVEGPISRGSVQKLFSPREFKKIWKPVWNRKIGRSLPILPPIASRKPPAVTGSTCMQLASVRRLEILIYYQKQYKIVFQSLMGFEMGVAPHQTNCYLPARHPRSTSPVKGTFIGRNARRELDSPLVWQQLTGEAPSTYSPFLRSSSWRQWSAYYPRWQY